MSTTRVPPRTSAPKGSTMTSAAPVPTATRSTGPARQGPAGTPRAPRRAAPARRVLALARAELLLLVRNRTTLFYALAIAPVSVAFLANIAGDTFLADDGAGALGRFVLTSLVALALLFVVYYNLTTTLVARREELVLKRLLTGEVSRTEAVVACAVPAVAMLLAQVVLGAVAVAVWLEAPPVTQPLWILLGLAGGTAVFVLLAAASSGVTRTVESAQLTTLPVMLVVSALSGFTIPLDLLPDVVGTVASWTPMYPVVALLEAGLGGVPGVPGAVGSGIGPDGVGQPLLCLVLWVAVGAWATRRWMRWEPRR